MNLNEAMNATADELFNDWVMIKYGPVKGRMLLTMMDGEPKTYADLAATIYGDEMPASWETSIKISAQKLRQSFDEEGLPYDIVARRPRPTHNEFETTFQFVEYA